VALKIHNNSCLGEATPDFCHKKFHNNASLCICHTAQAGRETSPT
jgi:hypothetical protein